jgi:hypothetical protein
MTNLDAVREDVEVEMASEFSHCRGNIFTEREALWIALRDERLAKRWPNADKSVIAITALRILVNTREDLCANAEDVGGEELRAFLFKDNTGMWGKAKASL